MQADNWTPRDSSREVLDRAMEHVKAGALVLDMKAPTSHHAETYAPTTVLCPVCNRRVYDLLKHVTTVEHQRLWKRQNGQPYRRGNEVRGG